MGILGSWSKAAASNADGRQHEFKLGEGQSPSERETIPAASLP